VNKVRGWELGVGSGLEADELGEAPNLVDSQPALSSQLLTPNYNKCYKQEWKFFKELDKTEEVATLNQETGDAVFIFEKSELRTR